VTYGAVCICIESLKGPPKGVLGVILGVGAKIFGGKIHTSLQIQVATNLFKLYRGLLQTKLVDICGVQSISGCGPLSSSYARTIYLVATNQSSPVCALFSRSP